MAYPIALTTALTGASPNQLYVWNKSGFLTPEISTDSTTGFLWSFRDLVALRTFMKLRSSFSLQKIRKAMSNLRDLNLTEHPSSYTLTSDNDSIFLVEDKDATDLLKRSGQRMITNLDDVFKGFTHPNNKGFVVDFRAPRPRLEIDEHRLGGFPTIRGTRVAYDSVATLIADGSIAPEDAGEYYVGVDAKSAVDALDFYRQVEAKQGWVA